MTDEKEEGDSRVGPAQENPPTSAGDAEDSRQGYHHGPIELRDQFYRGVIAWVHWGHERGVVRSATGREYPFEFPLVRVVGEPRKVESLQAGMQVGFDVGWTSKGLRVTTLKVYE